METGINGERTESPGGFGMNAEFLTSPYRLCSGVQSPLQIAHKPLQSFASAASRRQMIRDHSCMAQIQQKSGLLGGKAQKVLVVVVDDFHQVSKRHTSFVVRK